MRKVHAHIAKDNSISGAEKIIGKIKGISRLFMCLTMLSALTLTSCTDSDDVVKSGNESWMKGAGPKPIKLSASISERGGTINKAKSRVSYNLDTELAAGERVYTWIFDTGRPSGRSSFGGMAPMPVQLYGASTFQVLGTSKVGYLAPINSSGSTNWRYFPLNNDSVNIYALHGNFSSTLYQDRDYPGKNYLNPDPSDTLYYSIKSNQTEKSTYGSGYAASDLMYASEFGVPNTKDTDTLHFHHLLSKVRLSVELDSSQWVSVSKIEILNTVTSCYLVFDPWFHRYDSLGVESSVGAGDGHTPYPADVIDQITATLTAQGKSTAQIVNYITTAQLPPPTTPGGVGGYAAPNPQVIPDTLSSVQSISLDTVWYRTNTPELYNEAIVVPQRLKVNDYKTTPNLIDPNYASGMPFIRVTLSVGTSYTFRLTDDMTLESNKQYIYHLKLRENQIVLKYEVQNWTDVPKGDIEAEQD